MSRRLKINLKQDGGMDEGGVTGVEEKEKTVFGFNQAGYNKALGLSLFQN